MDLDELMPRRTGDDPLAALARQDLDPLSVDELDARIAALQAEIERTRSKLDGARSFRSVADSLFKKG